ncbi:MAG TPA: MraY family glycosyltransferase [Thermomicrobiaceae bacterium]|nr:MraY family glycosyltransferase [Thermomicrobiaceae bacterium]
MTHALITIAVALVAGLVSAGLVRTLERLAVRLGLVQAPREERDVHDRPLPRIGGLGPFVGFLTAVGVSFWFPVERYPVEVERILLLAIGSVLVVAVMLYDDLVGASPLHKLGWQAAAAAMVTFPRLRGPGHGLVIGQFNNPFGGVIHLPAAVAIGVTFFWILGMMNTVNWIDGLDGLAGSVTLIAALVLFIHTYFQPPGDPQFTISLLPAALGAAVIGFLPFNWHPARILMGDTGAMFLGFALAVISIIGGAKIATALLTLWVPILDVAWVILYRLLNGHSPLQADAGHLHHRLLELGWTQRQIVLVMAGISALLGAVSLLAPGPELKLFALVVVGVVGLAVLGALARHSGRLAERAMSESTRRP